MNRSRFLIAGLFLTLLVSQVPIFLQLTLTPDAVLYDVQARCLLEGGVLYRDVLEPNLPGIVWVHAVVRSVAGWSAEVLRSFDLCVVVCSCWLLVRLSRVESSCRDGEKRAAQTTLQRPPQTPLFGLSATSSPSRAEQRYGLANGCDSNQGLLCARLPECIQLPVLLTFYLGTSEWCHCQRDVWMLLPSLLAVTLRIRFWRDNPPVTEGRPPTSRSRKAIVVMGLSEGAFWGAAFWLKPFVAVPAVAVICSSRRFASSLGSWRLC